MAELPDDAVEAAAQAIAAENFHPGWTWEELLDGTKLVFRRHAQVALRAAAPLIAARVRAEAVAGERQRIKATVWTERGLLADRERALAVVNRIIDGAAGPAPVATPDPLQLGTYLVDSYLSGREDGSEWALIDNAKPDDLRTNLQYALRLLAGSGFGPVATPTEPDEHERQHLDYGTWPCAWRGSAECPIVEELAGAASPVPAEQPHPWFRETPESLALLETERAEVAAVEAAAEQASGDLAAFDRRVGEGEAAAELLGHRLTVGEAVPAGHSAPAPGESWGGLAADVMGLVDQTLDGEPPAPAEPHACSTCAGTGVVHHLGVPGSLGAADWLTCPDCGPTPSRPAGQPEER